MIFNSLHFLIFFPIVTISFYLLPHKLRWVLLLGASFYFYMVFIPSYVLILFFTIIIDYIAGLLLEKSQPKWKKTWLIISIVANVGILAFFKYINFIIENLNIFTSQTSQIPYLDIILPIGLSFHTFQAMSYTIEVYKGNQKAEKHFGIYALYVMFYPQLVAGPIERPQNVLPQIHKQQLFKTQNLYVGLRLILWGLFKKVVIADRLAILVDNVYQSPSETPFHGLLLALVFFSFQIYCDFSGYTDIARGSAKSMGIDLMKNFNSPYVSASITEFWSRWHISLSTWFRDYIYIPLGGNRVPLPSWIFNIVLVFAISGLWHGADWKFIIWGGLYGLIVVLESIIRKKITNIKLPIFISYALTFIVVSLIWVLFRASNLQNAIEFYLSLSNNFNYIANINLGLNNIEILFSIGLILFLLIMEREDGNIPYLDSSFKNITFYIFIALSCYFFGVFNNTSFIYFQF